MNFSIRDYLSHPRSTAAYIFLACLFLGETATGQEEAKESLAEAAARNPAVAAVLDVPHEKPVDALEAVFTLIELDEFTAAGEVFKPVADQKLSDDEMAEIADRLGTARMLSLAGAAGEKQIPGARAFAEKCLAAAAKQARSPENLQKLIGELNSDFNETRQAARHDLAVIGTPAASACLHALANATDKQHRAQLLLALAEMRPLVNPLLVAALADSEGQFRRDIAELVGHLQLVEAVPFLAMLAAGGDENSEVVAAAQGALMKMGLSLPNQSDALAVIKREIKRLDAGIPTDEISSNSELWWTYDPAKQIVTSQAYSPSILRSLAHSRLSRCFLQLPAASDEDRRLAILSALETASLLGQKPADKITELANELSTSELNSALATAMETDRAGAAFSICKRLEERGDLSALTSYDGLPTPLARAVVDSNSKVQMAALAAIMKINPQQSFAGASAVPAALWRFASGSGEPQAIVGAPNPAHAEDWAGGLRGLGFDAIPVFSGIDVVEKALESPRLALVLVDSDIGKPLLREVLYQLRTHSRLAHVPVAILSGSNDLQTARQIAEVDPYLLTVSRPHGEAAMKSLVDRLTLLADNQFTAEASTQQAKQAIEWLAQLLQGHNPYDELLRNAEILEQTVFQKELSQVSLAALASAGTAGSQQTLADFASMPNQPLELRRQAAQAFAKSVDRFGCLLTADQIAAQYDRYNASETADTDTQQVLSVLLDTIETEIPVSKP